MALPALARTAGYGVVIADSTGRLRSLTGGLGNDLPEAIGCPMLRGVPWTLCGNNIGATEVFGTVNNTSLRIITNNQVRMTIRADGKVGIGTTPPPIAIPTAYRLFVEDGIATRDVQVKAGTWPDYVFKADYDLLSLNDLRQYIRTQGHLPLVPSAAEVKANDGFEVGDLSTRMLRTIEEQALYILQLEERLRTVEQRITALETSK